MIDLLTLVVVATIATCDPPAGSNAQEVIDCLDWVPAPYPDCERPRAYVDCTADGVLCRCPKDFDTQLEAGDD